MAEEHTTQEEEWTDEDFKNFQGMTPEDFFAWHESEQEKGPCETIYKGYGELLQAWYAWCESHKLKPLTDFATQTRIFVEAEDLGLQRSLELVEKSKEHLSPDELTEKERSKVYAERVAEIDRQINNAIQEKGYIAIFERLTTTVNAETLQLERQNFFKKPPQRNVPLYSKALYELPKSRKLTWEDFYNYYLKILTDKHAHESKSNESPFAIATHSYVGPMRRLLLDKAEARLERVKVRESGRVKSREVVGQLALPEGIQPLRTPEAYLQELTHALLKHRDTSLLKVHLDLTNQAFLSKRERPIFRYDVVQAAKRLGSALQSHGSYHTDTLRGIYTRVLALNFHRIDVYELKEKRRGKLIIRAPFWMIRGEGYAEEGDVLGDSSLPLLLTDNSSPIIKLLILEPGDWWQAAGMSQGYYFHLPSSLLQLPTDSRSETNHIAIRLAAELAVWERTNQKGEPEPIKRKVGTLLERAGVTSFDEIKGKHPEQQKRLRKYLVGENGEGGAFQILREHGAFAIDIEDETDFWASSRGWFDKFWESRVNLQIRPYEKVLK